MCSQRRIMIPSSSIPISNSRYQIYIQRPTIIPSASIIHSLSRYQSCGHRPTITLTGSNNMAFHIADYICLSKLTGCSVCTSLNIHSFHHQPRLTRNKVYIHISIIR
ncbi:hypothetical protein PoB_000644500 [Plakobranchus ocellatus]|uniref:Uncharacterized protein n=1 Tax=Plakobranchus ocellatus TaxID=259542 RepID=A0AAV3YA08_9GAST|nr:hypothetical protein PoB_000644500 [Plakobranchus ocellatus]